MSREPKESKFFKWIYAPLIAPAILLILGAVVTGKVVIQITGFQLSLGLTVIVILIIFAVMVVSFLLGIPYLLVWGICMLLRADMPWFYRLATRLILKPILWIIGRMSSEEDREADKQDIAEAKAALARYHARLDHNLAQELEAAKNISQAKREE